MYASGPTGNLLGMSTEVLGRLWENLLLGFDLQRRPPSITVSVLYKTYQQKLYKTYAET